MQRWEMWGVGVGVGSSERWGGKAASQETSKREKEQRLKW